jgi:predicted transcriptional regulator
MRSELDEKQIDVIVYGCVNDHPALSAAGIQHLWKGFSVATIQASLDRLEACGLITSERETVTITGYEVTRA